MRFQGLLALSASLVLSPLAGRAQEVVSAQSGVIHYMEGAVTVDKVPLQHKAASFPLLKDGSVLSTEKGRVELMLTPGTFLRLDENSSIKMLSSALTATKIQFDKGAVILDALAAQGDIPIQLQYKDATVSFSKPGLYRVDSDTEVLQVYSGEAVVKQEDKANTLDSSRLYFFELGTDTKKFDDGTEDEFLDWAQNRSQEIAAENQAAQADNDDANADADAGLAPFSSNQPFGSLNAVPGPSVPNYGGVYPYSYDPFGYGGFYYNSYAPTLFFALPPIVGPAIILGRPYYRGYRGASPPWPHSGTWPHLPSSTGMRLSTPPRPMTIYSHPIVTHSIVVPHVAAPAVHPIPHR